ncbi:MAG: hypothetical protein JXA99_08000 [Candidatus Lokiarchaeota archaeon]|nr:hypothetical protein [Candidatus Lokiarchaeota archaeon]
MQLSGIDIFLIPEQEDSDFSTCQTIGLNWSNTLKSFINSGGIVILLDYGGETYNIYNSSELMIIMDYVDCTDEDTTYINQNSPLTIGINGNFTLPNGSNCYVTNEIRSVVEYNSNPVIIHKSMGKGHIVLMGIDFFDVITEASIILGNAIGLTPNQSGGIPGYDMNILIGLGIFSIGITLIMYKKRFKINN